MALNVNIIGKDSEGNLRALKVNSEGNLDFGQLETEIQAVKDNQGRLYGKYGEVWIPVKVDSEGRPIIASDVTVNAEGMVVDLGQIKQGPAGTEPWPVQLSGTVVETVILHNEIAITDTDPYGVNLDVSKYKAFNIWIRNSLNQPIKVRYDVFFPPGKGNNTNHLEWKDDRWSREDFKTVIPPGGDVYNLTSIIMPKHRFTRMIRLVVRCDIAPTSGSILSWVEGELR